MSKRTIIMTRIIHPRRGFAVAVFAIMRGCVGASRVSMGGLILGAVWIFGAVCAGGCVGEVRGAPPFSVANPSDTSCGFHPAVINALRRSSSPYPPFKEFSKYVISSLVTMQSLYHHRAMCGYVLCTDTCKNSYW